MTSSPNQQEHQPQPNQNAHQRHRANSLSLSFHPNISFLQCPFTCPSLSMLSLLFIFLFSSSLFHESSALPALKRVNSVKGRTERRDSADVVDLNDLKTRVKGQGHVVDLAEVAPASNGVADGEETGEEKMSKYLDKLNKMEYDGESNWFFITTLSYVL